MIKTDCCGFYLPLFPCSAGSFYLKLVCEAFGETSHHSVLLGASRNSFVTAVKLVFHRKQMFPPGDSCVDLYPGGGNKGQKKKRTSINSEHTLSFFSLCSCFLYLTKFISVLLSKALSQSYRVSRCAFTCTLRKKILSLLG